MKEKISKTNVARLLDKAKVNYTLVPYNWAKTSNRYSKRWCSVATRAATSCASSREIKR